MPTQTDQPLPPRTVIADLPEMTQAMAERFSRLDVHNVADLLRHLPSRYEHESAEDVIARLPAEGIGSTRGELVSSRWVPGISRRAKGRFEAVLQDDTGALQLTWFNASYLRDKLHPGMHIRVMGKTKPYRDQLQMINPRWDVLEDIEQDPARDEKLRPIYPQTEKLNSAAIERVMVQVLPRVLPVLEDPLPGALLKHHEMPPLADAFRMAHQPEHEDETGIARRRVAFNELILLQLGIALKRRFVHDRLKAHALKHNDAIDKHIRDRFPFPLTDAQSKVIGEIVGDLTQERPMNRLLQGDVGSGKTVVALYALLMAVADRKQGALMAPTELLAEQHYLSISNMLEGSNVRVGLLTGTTEDRDLVQGRLRRGQIDIVAGTHALLSESVTFDSLAVLVIDEQHRFGVMQRAAFRSGDEKQPHVPHHLVMTATPIPRTLSLTIFGDLDNSTITALPPGRTPVTNRVVGPEQSREVYDYLRTRIERGEQAYVVLPAIDAVGRESSQQLKNVREHARMLQEKYLVGFAVASVHGRLKRRTREGIMDRFRRGHIHVLVATTVIEVGVDVPNATVMVIEHAERFGLSQLHQLRGRVGRGNDGKRGLCVFVAEPTTDDATRRLEAIASTNDGFRIAELDLQIRGMGDFFGTRQHGLPPLRVAKIPDDLPLLDLARRDAQAIVDADPLLKKPEHALLRRVLEQQFGGALGLIDVG